MSRPTQDLNIRRNHKHRGTKTKDLDRQTLVTDAHKVLEASGAQKSHSWASRAVRDFERTAHSGMTLEKFLTNRLQEDANRRATDDAKRRDRRHESIRGTDPTFYDAVWNIGRKLGGGPND